MYKTTLVHNDHLFSFNNRLKLISLRTYKHRRLVFFSAFSGRKLCLTIMGPRDKKQEQKMSKEKFLKTEESLLVNLGCEIDEHRC